MADKLIFAAMMTVILLGPLGWRIQRDRLAARADVIRAGAGSALRHALGGESFITVDVTASTVWRRGQVVLGVPPGWDVLVKAAWDPILDTLPEHYDLVIRGAHRAGAIASRTMPSNTRENGSGLAS